MFLKKERLWTSSDYGKEVACVNEDGNAVRFGKERDFWIQFYYEVAAKRAGCVGWN